MLLSVRLTSLIILTGFGNASERPYPDPFVKEKHSGTDVDAGTNGTATGSSDIPDRLKTPRTIGGSKSNSNTNGEIYSDGSSSPSTKAADGNSQDPVSSSNQDYKEEGISPKSTGHVRSVKPNGSSNTDNDKPETNTSTPTKTGEGSSQVPASNSNQDDSRLALSPRSKGHEVPVGENGSSNTENTGASSPVDNTRDKPPPVKTSVSSAPVVPAAFVSQPSNPSAVASPAGKPASTSVSYPCSSLPSGVDKVPFSCFDQKKLKDYCTQTFGTSSQTVQVTPGNRESGMKRYTIDTTIKANWFQAVGLCLSRNMSLATVESFNEQQALGSVLNEAGGVQNAWLSATDLGQTNGYIWMSTGQPVSWTNWYEGEPNHEYHGNETEHCVEVINYKWKWNDNYCNNQEYFVCQYYTNNR